MINNRDCFFYKKSDFINRLQDISSDSVCYIADTQQIYTHGRYFECNVTQDVVEQLIQNHGYLTAADLPVLTGGASPTPGEYVTGVSVGGHNVNVQKGKLSEINVGTASKLETPRKIELSGDLSGSIMFDGSQDVNIETIVHNSTTADRLTTPRTISLSSQATGQVSFDGSGNVDIPVTVNELDSKNSNNRDLNSLVTLNGYGGSLFYGIGGNTSVNKPSGVDWFGLFSFKSASGNYTTQILGSNNRLYSRSNADTSLGSWNTIAYLTDNVASATKLKNTRTFTISDGTNSGTASNFDGTGNVTLRLPGTINANIVGDITGDIIGDVTGDLHGNADTATKLQTGRNINGTLFDGTKNITTAQWGTARNVGIVNSDGTGTAIPISVNGATNVNLRLPSTIKANIQGNVTGDITGNLNGNASTASKLQTPRTITLTGDATGSTNFDGSTNIAIAVDVNTASKLATARTITLTGDASGSASFDGSANISIPVVIANDSHTHATSASSNATTNLTITAGGTTATIADLYATYADRLRTARTISLTGDVTGSASFNGAGNVSIATTVANNSHTHTFSNITDKPISVAWYQGNNNNITTAQFLDLLEEAGAFKYGWFHARGAWTYASTSNITDTGYGTLDLAGSAITVWGHAKTKCTILVIPPLNSNVSPTVALGNMYIYVNNGDGYVSGWRKIARFEDIDWNNITNKPSSFTPSSHTHTLSQISNLNASWDSLLANAPSAYLTRWPSISEVTGKQNLTIQFNGTTQGGGAYNGTVARTINITPSAIGAATSSHSHSNYVQKSGDTMTGALTISTSGCPLHIQGGSNVESYLDVRMGGTKKSAFGYNSNLGTFLYSYPYGGYLSLTDSGLARIYKGSSLVGTLWHSGNDGSESGLNADLLDGYHESSFLRNRTAGNIDFNTITESGIYRLSYTVSNGATNGPSNNEWGQMLVLHGSGDTIAQLSIGYSSGSSIRYRSGNPTDVGGSGSWNSWKTVLDSYNYDSYTVTKTGGGASGTWGINVSGNAATATKLQNIRTINGTNFNGTANITTANWGTARTITIGNTGKSVNGSGNVSWSLAEIGAAATSHSHSYLPLAGGTMTGIINTDNTKGKWISGKTNAAIRYNSNSSIDSNSAWYFYNMKSASGNVIAFGGLGDNIGFYTFDAARTENGTDSSFLCNTNTGVWTFSNTPTVSGTSVSLNGHTHSWSSITSKPSWIGSSKPSYSWNEISGKPSSYTPSSHTHPISQITGRGTLTFTGAATGSYDGSGNLTINIPSGGMSSVSWSDISGKPSTFTPSAHTHGTNNITALTGYTEGSSTTTLSSSMTLNAALASLQNQIQTKVDSLSDLGITATAAELNKLDGCTATVKELNYVDGVTSNIQTQLNGKASSSHTHSAATTSAAGFMSAADKSKLDGITAGADSVSVSRNLTSGTQIASITINGTATELFAPTNTDTKNTTGTFNSLSKLYLVGGTSQSSAGVVTYSNNQVYTQLGQLYAAQMNATNGFYETSDARLKNFKEDVKALDTISEIPTKYFTWKKDKTEENPDLKLHIGTSAQEIQKLYPELVTENEEGELSVDYARLSIIALAAIKELKKEIDELKSALIKYKS